MKTSKSNWIKTSFQAMAFFALAGSLSAFATDGGGGTGGGDWCENRIKVIRDDIAEWINGGGPKGLNLTPGVTVAGYSQAMLAKISAAKIRCVGPGDDGYPVNIDGTAKTCRFDSNSVINQITCDFAKFKLTGESDQYVLIHHEYAGMASLETPSGDESKYYLSNQLTGYLVDQIVKKLAIHPEQTQAAVLEDCAESSGSDAEVNFFDDVRNLRVACVKQPLSYQWHTTGILDINAKNAEGQTALNAVASLSFHPSVCRNSSSDSACGQEVDRRKSKALAIAKLLIGAGANLEVRDKYENTPAISAVYSNPDLTIALVQAGADIKAVGFSGNCVLHETYDPRIVQLYIQARGNLNQEGESGWTPIARWINWSSQAEQLNFHYGMHVNLDEYKRAISTLVNAGADINAGKHNALHELKRQAGFLKVDVSQMQMYSFLISLGARD